MSDSFKSFDTLNVSVKTLSSIDLISETSYDKWTDLTICDGAVCKRIKTPSDYHGFLIKFETGAKTLRHKNFNEYEILDVRVGRIKNLVTNETYVEGDVITFDKGEEHELYCQEEAYIYCVMSKNKRDLG